MRIRIWSYLLLATTIVLVSDAGRDAWRQLADRFSTRRPSREITVSQTYLLAPAAWLDFHLPAATDAFWVLTNANFAQLPPAVPADMTARSGWNYALEYQILDAGNGLLDQGEYHFRSPPRESTAGHAQPPTFYANRKLLPGISQSLRYQLANVNGSAARLRLRLLRQDATIQDVAVRVYGRETIPDYKLKHAWRRTSKRRREKLCRASAYSPELLSDYEIRSLLRHRWLPLPPAGSEGRDYRRRQLYTVKNQDDEQFELPLPPAGLLVTASCVGMVPLPAGDGTVRLELLRVTEPSPGSAPLGVDIRWSGSAVDVPVHRQATVEMPRHEMQFECQGGMLEIVTDGELVVRAFWAPTAGPSVEDFQEITPQPATVRGYAIGGNRPITYAVNHVGQLPTPLKIVLRRLLPAAATPITGSADPPPVHWQFLDSQKRPVEAGRILLDTQVSPYDRVGGISDNLVSDGAVWYFAVPENVDYLRLRAAHADVLASAYTRPPDVPKVTVVPDDYSAFHRQEGWRRSWFAVKPVGKRQLVNELRCTTIVAQARPTPHDPRLLAGQYQWQSFRPGRAAKSRYLLLPRELQQPLPWHAAASAFSVVTPGNDRHFQLVTAPGQQWLQPHVICHAQGPWPKTVRVHLAGRLHQELSIRSETSEFLLEPLAPNPGQPTPLRIENEAGIRVLMSHVDPPAGQVHYKRLVSRFEHGHLQFEYEKLDRGEELLNLTLFCGVPRTQPARLRVSILGGRRPGFGPSRDWTILDRMFELEASRAVPVHVLAAAGELVAEQAPCFLRLGADLPPAKYVIDVRCETGDGRYLLMSKTTPGLFDRRKLLTECGPESSSVAAFGSEDR